jgi:hypothetical protein
MGFGVAPVRGIEGAIQDKWYEAAGMLLSRLVHGGFQAGRGARRAVVNESGHTSTTRAEADDEAAGGCRLR